MRSPGDAYRRLGGWIRGAADRPSGPLVLWMISFLEASVLPLSVDIPLIALCLARRSKARYFGLIAVTGAVAGGCAGYVIGALLFTGFGSGLVATFGLDREFTQGLSALHGRGMWILVTAGFTPIPFFLFTIAAGWTHAVDPASLILGLMVGRTLRFMPVALAVHFLGDPAIGLFKRYRKTVYISGTLMLVGAIAGIFWYVLR